MEGFSINYVIFQKRLHEVAAHLNSLGKEINSLTEYVENLDIFWDGDANNAYKIRVYSDIDKMNACIENTYELMKMCDEAVANYQETEKVVMQMIGGFRIEKQK